MGMFDRLYDATGKEWQTKAYGCILDEYRVGDELPYPSDNDYQVEILADRDAYATVRSGVLVSLPDERDARLPVLVYGGGELVWKD